MEKEEIIIEESVIDAPLAKSVVINHLCPIISFLDNKEIDTMITKEDDFEAILKIT